jgi:hypothetical protein
MPGRRQLAALVLVALSAPSLTLGCKSEETTAHPEPAAGARPGVWGQSPHRESLPVDWMAAPAEGAVAEIVQREVARAGRDGHHLLVYVGAVWCEPCQRFHQAAQKGELDATFPGLRLLEFDLDRDRDRLHQAGYASKMIPLFALPRADGVSSGEQVEGAIKGERAVDYLAPKLRALLDK